MNPTSAPRRPAFQRAFLVVALALAHATAVGPGQLDGQDHVPRVEVVKDASGHRLQVDGEDFMVQGINWDYFPIGTTYSYNFWAEPDDLIEAALDREMGLARTMGVNTIRIYAGIPPRWVRYIYEKHGIFSVVNHPLGRYGLTVDGVFRPNTNYSDPAERGQVLAEIDALIREFDGTPGVLMWLLGNENNYGLVWTTPETEDLPVDQMDNARARHLYSLVGEAASLVKALDPGRPVGFANGDLQYIDLIAEEASSLDVLGSNVYRGASFRDLFEEVDEKLGIPVMFTEFGADAWHARHMREDQLTQATILVDQWREIYEQSAGKGGVGNAIGGLTFQWTDGWWKFGQEDNLDVQDTNASWSNAAYPEDFIAGGNNMNEEWWGIVAKGPTDRNGLYELYPRAAFYALRDVYEMGAYDSGVGMAEIAVHFESIDPEFAVLQARGDLAARGSPESNRFEVSHVRGEFETIQTGGDLISTSDAKPAVATGYPSFQGFDQMQSFYGGIKVRPVGGAEGEIVVNAIGNVAENPIDEIFYENRGRQQTVETVTGARLRLNDIERVKVYQASLAWDDEWFRLNGFYRTGHYHWGYEGDFFNLYREANYGPNIDIYNGMAPIGVEVEGKRMLSGLKVAMGPSLWWGANPMVIAKLQRSIGGGTTAAVVFQEDMAQQSAVSSSFAIPLPPTRKATVHVEKTMGPAVLEAGGIWSGSTKKGETYQVVNGESGSYEVFRDAIEASDAFGVKAKVSVAKGRWNWYLQGASMGLVADGGPTQTQTFTGWWVRDSNMGNQMNVLSGVALKFGNWEVAPNLLWQRPVVGPIPGDAGVRPRNVIDDPFAVRAWSRETRALEFLLGYDPTPATWLHTWDSDVREDAPFAALFSFVYKSFPTTQDASIGILADGRTPFAFPGAPGPRDIWEVRARLISKGQRGRGIIANLYTGTGEPNGENNRLVRRHGAEVRALSGPLKLETYARINDWGPYDYHRDFNLTFPLQLMGDISYSIGLPQWFADLPGSRLGIRATWRSLDQYSPRYCPKPVTDSDGFLVCEPGQAGPKGSEWEVRTYLHFSM